jgi:hypothetical protein
MEPNEREQLPELELDDLLNAWEIECPSDRLRAAVFPARVRGRVRRGVWLAAAAGLMAACLAGALWNHATKASRSEEADGIAFVDSADGAGPFTPILTPFPCGAARTPQWCGRMFRRRN